MNRHLYGNGGDNFVLIARILFMNNNIEAILGLQYMFTVICISSVLTAIDVSNIGFFSLSIRSIHNVFPSVFM